MSFPLPFALHALGKIWPTGHDASHNCFFELLSRADLILANDVETNLAALRAARTTAQATALEHLKQYVVHRTRAFEAFNRIDPDSQATQDARQRLDKATRDYETFARAIGVVVESPEAPVSESGENEAASRDPDKGPA